MTSTHTQDVTQVFTLYRFTSRTRDRIDCPRPPGPNCQRASGALFFHCPIFVAPFLLLLLLRALVVVVVVVLIINKRLGLHTYMKHCVLAGEICTDFDDCLVSVGGCWLLKHDGHEAIGHEA